MVFCQATAVACANLALIKYWGKRDETLNLPAVGSISITLKNLSTRTKVIFDNALSADALQLNGKPQYGQPLLRISRFLDVVRSRSHVQERAMVETENNFPTGAGLASSASGFAALALAATDALGQHLTPCELSGLARMGSGSAARSMFGGFVEMVVGEKADGSDAVARPLLEADAWPISVVIAVTCQETKPIGSTTGMSLTRETSPYWQAWQKGAESDLQAMRQAILSRDLEQVGELAEHSCLKMHALALAARPGLIYWHGATVELMHRVRALRKDGVMAYFSIDAGPQVKVLCLSSEVDKVASALSLVNGVERLMTTELGSEARLV